MDTQKTLIEKYSKILVGHIDSDEISSIHVANDEKTDHRACHVQMMTVMLKSGQNLELFVKNRRHRDCPAMNCQLTAVMLIEGKFLTQFVGEIKSFCEQHAQSAHVITNLMADLFPFTYYCDEDTIVMENLVKRGYRALTDHFRHDYQEAEIVLKNLARFHAVTHMVIQSQGGSEKFLQNHPNFENPLLKKDLMKFFSPAFDAGFTDSLKIVQRANEHQQVYNFLHQFEGKLEEIIVQVTTQRRLLATICHANLCPNNIMFGSEAEGDTKVMFVDFQTARIGSPNADISYYFFRSIQSEARRKWKDLLRIYFAAFEKTMRSLGQPFEFTFEDFVKDFLVKSKMGFLFGVFLAPGRKCHTRPEEDVCQEIVDMVNDYINFTNTEYSE